MRAIAFAWRSLVRQPARAVLGVLGVAAVGALLFDMLLLSRGLMVSMRDLLDRTGWDVRVTSTDDLPGRAPRIPDGTTALTAIRRLEEVRGVLGVRFAEARVDRPTGKPLSISIEGVTGNTSPPWTVTRGADPAVSGEAVINDALASELKLTPGDTLLIRPSCGADSSAPPPVQLRITGLATFPFEAASEYTIGVALDTLNAACANDPNVSNNPNVSNDPNASNAPNDSTATGSVDMILVLSAGDADVAADAIAAAVPRLRAVTNEEVLGRMQQNGFTYFRQISVVLTTVTLSFAVLLITVLLTVSVNQRLGEIAALRALGFSRPRVVVDVLAESALIVGAGGALSVPLGLVLANVLDGILKEMPGIPTALHFFVFEPRALVLHMTLLVATTIAAAGYPMRLVARLPIAATLRAETAD